MRNFRLLVEFQTYAMPAEVAHHRVAVLLGMMLDGIPYVAHETKGLGGFHTNLEAFLGYFHQPPLLRRYVANHKHTRRVGEIAVEDSRNIHVDNIAVAQDFFLARDSVADYFINGRADAFRESFVVERGRDGSVRYRIIEDQAVDLGSRHPFVYFLFNQIQDTGIDHTAPADAFDLLRCLNQIAAGDQMSLILQIEDFLIQFRQWLPFDGAPVINLSS